MALYEDLCKIDVLRPILHEFENKRFRMLRNGKIGWMSRAYIEPNSPWKFAKVSPERDCSKWLDVYHKYYQIIPKSCRSCWKVSYRPKSLSELMRIYKLQVEMGKPAKCGIETRPLTGNRGGYGSFWYVPLDGGLKTARGLYEIVREKLMSLFLENPNNLGSKPGKKLSLKRGCTEMEHSTVRLGLGGSDTWDKGAKHYDAIEAVLDETFLKVKIQQNVEPEIMKIHTERMWIEWAYEHGDKTYHEFSEKGSFPLPLVNYAGSDHKERDFRAA